MKQCFGRLNLNWEEEGVTQASVEATAKKLKYEKSFWYKLKCNRKYKKVCKQLSACTDPALKCDLLLEKKRLLDTGVIK